MNNRFKRALSSILAFVMVISVLTVMNVTTALAAINTDSVDSNITTVYNFLGGTATELTEVSATVGSGTAKYLSAGAGYQVSTEYTSQNTGLKLTADSTKAPKFNNVSSIEGSNHLEIPATAGDTIYVYGYRNNSSFGDSTLLFCTSTTYSTTEGSVDVTSVRGTVQEVEYNVPSTFTGSTIYIVAASSGNNFDVAAVAVVSGSATSLSLDNASVSLEPGGTATVTATAKNAGTPTISWSSTDTEESVIKLSATTGSSVTITAVADGTATVTASFTYNKVTYSKSVTVTVATKVVFESNFDASDMSTGDIKIDILVSDNLFKIMPGPASNTSNLVTVASSSSGTVTLADGESYSSSTAVKTGGGGSATQRSIGFITGDTAGTIYYYAKSASTSTNTITVQDSEGDSPEGVTITNGTDATIGSSVTEIKITGLSANTEYYICASASAYIYYVASTEELVEFDELPTVDFDNYTVTGTDGTVYYIAGLASSVTADDVAEYETCYLDGAESADSSSITIIYEGVSVDDLTIEAARFGYSYVYGFEVINAKSLSGDYSSLQNDYTLTAE